MKRPHVRVNVESPLTTYFMLAEAGYGTVEEVRRWDSRMVQQALWRLKYKSDYDRASFELNKVEK